MTPATAAKADTQTLRAAENYLIAKADPAEFIHRFCYIKDENTGKVGRFRLWQYQRDLLHEWIEYQLNVNLKARQLGISWLVCGFALWTTLFTDNVTVLCISKTEKKAHDLISKILFMYDQLPEYMKKPLKARNKGSVVFEGDVSEEGSRIVAIASTPGSGVGYTASLIICDEWGEQEYAEDLYVSFKPTIDMGGRLIGVGTGNYIGSFYHEIWTKARSGENGFHARFLGWDLRPGRDENWYENTKATYPNQQEFLRQYPSNEVEAFIAAGGCPFQIEDLNWYLETHVIEPLPSDEPKLRTWSEHLLKYLDAKELWVWETPQPNHDYLVMYDPAGNELDGGGDYHAIHVMKLTNLEQVVEFQSRTDMDYACTVAWELARLYNNAYIVWESTGVGAAATNFFVRSGYDFLYEHEGFEQEIRRQRARQPSNEKTARLGWPASRATNHIRNTDLIAGIREHILIIHSSRWFQEAKGWVRQADGSYKATGRAHDDLITAMATGYTVALRMQRRRSPVARPIRTKKKRAFRRERWR